MRLTALASTALIALVGVVSGCGSNHRLTADQEHAQRIRAYAYLPSTRVECAGSACRLTATTLIHSEHEAFLIAWPLLFGTVHDPSLRSLSQVGLTLSDPRTGADLSLNCDRRRAGEIPAGRTSVAAVKQHCRWSWHASY